jgi:hypothetical protein
MFTFCDICGSGRALQAAILGPAHIFLMGQHMANIELPDWAQEHFECLLRQMMEKVVGHNL